MKTDEYFTVVACVIVSVVTVVTNIFLEGGLALFLIVPTTIFLVCFGYLIVSFLDLKNGVGKINQLVDLSVNPPNSYIENKTKMIINEIKSLGEKRIEFRGEKIRVQAEIISGVQSTKDEFLATSLGDESLRDWLDLQQWQRVQLEKAKEASIKRIFILSSRHIKSKKDLQRITENMTIQSRGGVKVLWTLQEFLDAYKIKYRDFGIIDKKCVMENVGLRPVSEIVFFWDEEKVRDYIRLYKEIESYSIEYSVSMDYQYFQNYAGNTDRFGNELENIRHTC